MQQDERDRAGGVGPQRVVGPVGELPAGREVRQYHPDDQEEDHGAQHHQGRAQRDPAAASLPRPGALQHPHDAQHGQHHAHVLAHQQQRQGGGDEAAVAAPVQRVQREGQQRDGEADLVEVEVHQAFQRPAQRICHQQRPVQPARSQMTSQEAGHDGDGGGDQRRLGDHQGARVVPDPVERRQQRQDRVEVVTQQVVVVPLEGHQRGLEARVAAHRLVEDPQVVAGGEELRIARQRVERVQREDRQREPPDRRDARGPRGNPRGEGVAHGGQSRGGGRAAPETGRGGAAHAVAPIRTTAGARVG